MLQFPRWAAPATFSTTTQTGGAPPPSYAAHLGMPAPILAPHGSSAKITLNGVRYSKVDEITELAVVDVTLVGTSARPFAYSESEFYFFYSDPDNAYAHTQDDHVYGVDPSEDYTPFLPPNPLRVGHVSRGQRARGLVILRMSPDASYGLAFAAQGGDEPLAEWALRSAK